MKFKLCFQGDFKNPMSAASTSNRGAARIARQFNDIGMQTIDIGKNSVNLEIALAPEDARGLADTIRTVFEDNNRAYAADYIMATGRLAQTMLFGIQVDDPGYDYLSLTITINPAKDTMFPGYRPAF